MQIVSLIGALLKIVSALISYAERRSLIKQGQRDALLAQYQEGAKILAKANQARADARTRIERDGLRDDDYRD